MCKQQTKRNILDEIADRTRQRITEQKQVKAMQQMREEALALAGGQAPEFPFLQALKKDGISLICEAKKASPSKGLIAEHFPYVEIARDYEAGGASAISVLTEPYYFLGSNEYLKEIRKAVSIPLLRKDFVVDPYMIYEAKMLGADACLLICSILKEETLKEYLDLAHSLGLSALVETHDDEEIAMALRIGARIIGVNNRNLKDFTVDVTHSSALLKNVPDDVVFVAESGITTKEQVASLYAEGVDAVLIGETFMRAEDRRAIVAEFANV
ncbi:MAG: indole-3-glycerol phosphate synthase TrpC [Lachnospiraceae bacterium]|nr:indole-3-glycerol phosphate synthase TrpC [Lachnospiraceae bacterium]